MKANFHYMKVKSKVFAKLSSDQHVFGVYVDTVHPVASCSIVPAMLSAERPNKMSDCGLTNNDLWGTVASVLNST